MGWPGSSVYTGAYSCPEGRVTGKAFCREMSEIVSQEDEREILVRKVVFEKYYSSEQHSTCLVLTGYIDSKLHTATVDIKNIMATEGLSFKECCRILKIPGDTAGSVGSGPDHLDKRTDKRVPCQCRPADGKDPENCKRRLA